MNFVFFNRAAIDWLIPGIFYASVLFELFFLLAFYLKPLFLKKTIGNSNEKPISICLCVRNEQDRIEEVLTQLLEQQYSNFEVLVVDDFSEDCTLQIIGQLATKFPKLKFTAINQETRFSEKLSINLAMKAVSHEHLVFLRASSIPINKQFLQKINACFDDSNLLINYSNFKKERTFYNKLCRIERFMSFLNSAAFSPSGLSLFCEGNNVLFQKSIYFDLSGFRGKMDHYYANLELIFNSNFKKNIKISIDPETQVREDVVVQRRDFSELIHKEIKLKRSLVLGRRFLLWLEDISKLIFVGSFILQIIVEPHHWLFIVLPALLIVFLHFFIVKIMSTRLKEEKIFLSSLVYVFVRPLLIMYQSSKMYIHAKRNKWN